MQVTERDGRAGRAILTGMIVNDTVAAAVAAKWTKDGLFVSRWENLIAGWVVQYYRRYRKAPGPAVQTMFDRWAESNGRDKETVELVERFLRGLSAAYAARKRDVNPGFVIDQASEHFTAVRLRNLRDEVDARMAAGDVAGADKLVKEYRRVEMGEGTTVRPLLDRDVFREAFSEDYKTDLITLPDALGAFFKHMLTRDAFVGLEGMAKVGKSFWLMFLVFMSIRQRRRTAFFETGDMSQPQIARRLGSLISRRPIFGDPRNPVRIPRAIAACADGPPDVEYDEQMFPDDLTEEVAWDAVTRFTRDRDGDVLRLSVHRNRSISMAGVENKIDEWAAEGWVPDVVAIDYMDLLAPINGRTETRDEINETWQAGRALSQKYHCLVLAPTQTDTASYNAPVVKRENFSGDRRKNDHVTAMVGINQTTTEKQAGLYRLNYVHGRDVDFTTQLWCASCLALSNPCVLSTF